MNGLKPMLLMVVLGGILYVVYVVLNRGPAPDPPPGMTKDWAKLPEIQLGTPAGDANGGSTNWNGAPGSMPPGPSMQGQMGSNGMSPNGMGPSGMGPNSSRPYGAGPYASGPSGMAANGMSPSGVPSNAYPSGGTGPSGAAGASGSTQTWPSNSPYGPPSGQVATAADPNHFGGGSAADARTSPYGSPPSADQPAPSSSGSFSSTMNSVKMLVADRKLVDALQMLTKWYDSPQLSAQETVELNDWLGRLAGTVVYSRENLLLPPYVVQPGDKLKTVADKYKVPWQLLAKINGIDVAQRIQAKAPPESDDTLLVTGEKLKVIRGPFLAQVSLNRQEVALFVQQCYAGRFRITSMGREAAKLDGIFDVNEKLVDPVYHSPQEPPRAVAELPVRNKVGFGQGYGLRGVSDPSAADDSRALNLDSRDAEDVFDILSMGSRIVVRR